MRERLTPADLINLYVETPSAPVRVGAVAMLDAGPLLDPAGRLRLADIRAAISARLAPAPRLRQVIRRAGPLGTRPVWVEDPSFRIETHVHEVALPDGVPLEDLATRLVTRPLDRAHPLWHLWFITGVPGGGVAMVLGMHHVMADGATTVGLIGALMDPGSSTGTGTGTAVAHRFGGSTARRSWRRLLSGIRHAPRTSLNHPVGLDRRLAWLDLDLAEVKAAAHQDGGKVNDVVLALAAGGLRELLLARAEPVEGVRLHASVAVSLRGGGGKHGMGNRTGALAVGLPLCADPRQRLRLIAGECAQAKAHQPMGAANALLVWLARIGLLRWFSRHQHMINIMESNVAGPKTAMTFLGATVTSIVPVGTLAGNISLGFLALSYAGRLTIAVQADAARFADLPVLLDAMRREAAALTPKIPEFARQSTS